MAVAQGDNRGRYSAHLWPGRCNGGPESGPFVGLQSPMLDHEIRPLPGHIVIQNSTKFLDTDAMAGNGATPGGSSPNSDDINDRLAEIAAELAAEAKFKEPSAAERARRRPGQAKPGAGRLPEPSSAPSKRPGRLRQWRNRRLAAELRRPVPEPGRPAPPVSKPRRGRRPAASSRARSRPIPDRGYATPARRASPARSIVTVVLVLLLLLGVSFGLHALLHRHRTPGPAGRSKIGLTRQGYQASSRDWVTSFAPGTTELVGKSCRGSAASWAARPAPGATPKTGSCIRRSRLVRPSTLRHRALSSTPTT
jgi:hypothetical protein